MLSVIAPMPIAVKKLMLNLVLRGLSIGKMLIKDGWSWSAFMRSCNFFIPMDCVNSSNRILMKIRDDDVVSSSFMWMTDRTSQPMASEAKR